VKITFEIPYKLYKLDSGPAPSTLTNREDLLSLFKEMMLVRKVEHTAMNQYQARNIFGFLHLYIGQEAVSAGMDSVLDENDCVITAYRCHSYMLSRRTKGTPLEVLAELYGRKAGCSKGKGGSMHLYKVDRNFYGGNGIVGSQIPLGAGLAFAQKFKKNGHVTLAAMGDGAANQGQVYESFNLAALHKLPIIFLVENNKYGMGTPVERASATSDFYTRGHYIPGVQFDGMNVLQSRETFKFAKEFVLKNGPLVVEAQTYRYQGHSASDPGTSYRQKSEVDRVKNTNDPIANVYNLLTSYGLASDEEIKAIEQDINDVVDRDNQLAMASPTPAPEDLFSDIYSEEGFVRGVELASSRVIKS